MTNGLAKLYDRLDPKERIAPLLLAFVHFVRNVLVAMVGRWIEDRRDYVAGGFAVVSAVEGFPIGSFH